MDWNNIFERIKLFVIHIPSTLKETFIWLSISYLIPIINIGIIWGIQQSRFKLSLGILSIILVTNACFLTALIYQVYTNDKKRKLINIFGIITFVITVVLFTVSIIEIEQKISIFSIDLYKKGSYATLFLSILLGLISKYDEVEAESKERAKKGKETKQTSVGDKTIKL